MQERQLTDDQLCAIVGFRAEGLSARAVANVVGTVSHKVSAIWFAMAHPSLNLQKKVMRRIEQLMKEE